MRVISVPGGIPLNFRLYVWGCPGMPNKQQQNSAPPSQFKHGTMPIPIQKIQKEESGEK